MFFCLVIVVHESLICPEQLNFLLFFCSPAVRKRSPMLQKEKPCIKNQGVKTFEQNEDVYIFLVLLKYHIFFHLVLQKPQKIVTCFPEDKLS